MLELETCFQQAIKVMLTRLSINDLAAALPALGRDLACAIAAKLLDELQAHCWSQVNAGACELVCTRCGVVHCGPGTLLRRGRRMRQLKTSSGRLVFALHQVTCRACGRTWSPVAPWLGLMPRQRVSEELERKLVECVMDLSYAKSCTLGAAWLGESLSPRTLHKKVQERGAAVVFTPERACAVVQADGTMVPAGKNPRGCDVWLSLQILGRDTDAGRRRVKKRIGGWAVGARGWEGALPSGVATELILTDREPGVPEFLDRAHPEVRHGLCEWHLGHTLDHLLLLDRVPNEQRKRDVAQLSRTLSGPVAERTKDYTAFIDSLAHSPRAQRMLRRSAAQVLYDTPPPERTTSVIEREMREINRRTDVGVRWSVSGVDNLLRLRHSRRINPDDFERVWSDVQMPSFSQVSLP
jgi:hypothetical protein